MLKEGDIETCIMFLQDAEKRVKSFESLLNPKTHLSLAAGLGLVLSDAYIKRFKEFKEKGRQTDSYIITLEAYSKEAQEYSEYINDVIKEYECTNAHTK